MIVITGVECDDPTVIEVRDRLIGHVGVAFTGTLTMQEWLWEGYWHVSPPPMLEAQPPSDKRLVREVIKT